MKTLEVVEETDPKGTVVGVLGVVHVSASPIPPLLWYLTLTAVILLMALVCLRPASGAADDLVILHESGHFSGTGYHEISASGPLCSIFVQPANDSIVWRIFSNGTLVGAA